MLRPLLAALVAVLILAAPAAAAPYDNDAYWAFADRMQHRMDGRWDEQAGYYKLGGGGVEPMANSILLLTHSVAAMQRFSRAALSVRLMPVHDEQEATAAAARLK